MARTDQQNERIRVAAREKLLETAMALFSEHGYTNTSIRNIAVTADVSVGLLYHYFENKEAVLRAVLDYCMAEISKGFVEVAGVAGSLEKIEYLVRNIFEHLQSEQGFWALFYSMRSQPAVMAVLGGEFREWTGRLREIFIDLYTEAGRTNPSLTAHLLYSLIEGSIQQYLLDSIDYPVNEVLETVVSQFIFQEIT